MQTVSIVTHTLFIFIFTQNFNYKKHQITKYIFYRPQDVPQLGCLYFKRYFAFRSVLDYNLTAFGLSAALIGMKVIGFHDRKYHISELVNKGYEIRLGRRIDNTEFETYRNDVLAYEFEILKFLKFDLYTRLPLSMVKDFAISRKDILNREMKCTHRECQGEPKCKFMTKALEYIDNACYSNAYITFSINDIALACYFLAKKAMNMPCTLKDFSNPDLIKKICVCIINGTKQAAECMKTISATAKT